MHVAFAAGRGRIGDREVQVSPAHEADQGGPVVGHDAHADIRVRTNQAGDGGRDEHLRGVRSGPDGQLADVQALEEPHLAAHVLGPAQHADRVLEEHPARVGGLRAVAAAVEEPSAHLRFERPYAAREGGLAEAERAGGAGVVPVLGESTRVTKEPQLDIHAPIVSK